jgi:hypothetical protein
MTAPIVAQAAFVLAIGCGIATLAGILEYALTFLFERKPKRKRAIY